MISHRFSGRVFSRLNMKTGRKRELNTCNVVFLAKIVNSWYCFNQKQLPGTVLQKRCSYPRSCRSTEFTFIKVRDSDTDFSCQFSKISHNTLKTSWRRLEDVFRTSWRRFWIISWRRLQNVLKITLQDVLKMSWRCLVDVFKTSWRPLEEFLKTFLQGVLKTSLRYLQSILKTFFQDVLKTSWRRLQDVWPRQIYQSWTRPREDVLKTSSEDEEKDVFIKTIVFWATCNAYTGFFTNIQKQ